MRRQHHAARISKPDRAIAGAFAAPAKRYLIAVLEEAAFLTVGKS